MNFDIGSNWNKWDLHIHTPFSIEQYYGVNNEETWEKFITDLENLPAEFKVIGINDYLFIDGYEKVLNYKEAGRLKNIDLILPVLEFRIYKFGGTESHWKRVNFHVIFGDSNTISTEDIKGQFLNTISQGYKLSPDYEGKFDWHATPTMKTLQELGQLIISSVPEDKKKDFDSPLKEGFNNLNYSDEKLLEILETNSYLQGKYFTAVGKAEWSSMTWNDQSIAEKKKVINRADFVFTSSKNPKMLLDAKKSLEDQEVKNRLLDCSDAHHFSLSAEKDKIGKCFTWLKADTTFEGLRQVIYEPERIFLGEIPPKLAYISQNSTKFIKSVEIRKKTTSRLPEDWFDAKIDFSKDLVAIIGNKGSGKSALLDILGVLGNTKIPRKHFPFLNQDQFLKENKAKNFHARIIWESDEVSDFICLGAEVDKNSEELVRYIPQNYFEEICTQLSQSSEDSSFYKELSKVIFSHVRTSERLGRENIDQLINHHREEIDYAIKQLILKLEINNQKIVEAESRLEPVYKTSIENKLSQKKKEYEALIEPENIEKPNQDDPEIIQKTAQIEELKKNLSENENHFKELIDKNAQINIDLVDIEKLKRRIENFQEEYNDLINNINPVFKPIIEKTISININFDLINSEIQRKIEEISRTEKEINKIVKKNNEIEVEIQQIQEDLDQPNKAYQKYLTQYDLWEKSKILIDGNKDQPDTIKYYENKLREIENVSSEIDILKSARLELSKAIFNKKAEISSIYSKLYSPVQDFITEQKLGEEFNLNFTVSIEIENFNDLFFSFISHAFAGSFYRIDEGEAKLKSIINSYNFNNFEEIDNFIKTLMDNLTNDKRTEKSNKVRLEDQLLNEKSKLDFYNFLFSLNYLKPLFVLKLGNKDIQILSPGEKGTLLLVFYLLIDQDMMPLLIDQPEHNLDNETVYKLLVECVKKAKNKRQIFIVTHNPNLAVVCDAEQVICSRIDKLNKNKVDYIFGAIENPQINIKLIDILEGTKPAFDKRRFKYLLSKYDSIKKNERI